MSAILVDTLNTHLSTPRILDRRSTGHRQDWLGEDEDDGGQSRCRTSIALRLLAYIRIAASSSRPEVLFPRTPNRAAGYRYPLLIASCPLHSTPSQADLPKVIY